MDCKGVIQPGATPFYTRDVLEEVDAIKHVSLGLKICMKYKTMMHLQLWISVTTYEGMSESVL